MNLLPSQTKDKKVVDMMSTNAVLSDEIDSESQNIQYREYNSVPYIIRKKRLLSFDSSVQVNFDRDQIFIELQNNKFKQDNYLDVENKQAVKFSSDLVKDLKLIINYREFFKSKEKQFDETLTYVQDDSSLFKTLVLKKKGYLSDKSDFNVIDSSMLTTKTKATTLRNTRVILFWRSLELKEYTISRILTLGLLFLIGNISLAELVFYIKLELPEGDFEVKIIQQKNNYVVIGIEKPIFSF